MTNNINRAGRGLRKGVLLAGLTLACGLAQAAQYGNCEVTGERGSIQLQTVTPNTLTVRPTIGNPGFWNGDSPDTIKDGMEYCLAANIAWRAGLDNLKLITMSFPQLLAGQTRNFDIALSQVTITDERKKTVDFTIPYYQVNQGLLVRKGTAVADGAIRSLQLGAQQGTTSLHFLEDRVRPEKPVKVFNDAAAMYAALAARQIDVAIYDDGNVLTRAANSGGRLEVAGQYVTGEQIGALMNKGSPNLEAFNTVLAQLRDDGTIDALIHKYLTPIWGVDPEAIPVLEP